MKYIRFSILLFSISFVVSCKKDTVNPPVEPAPSPQSGSLQIQFENVVDASALVFGQKYVNAKTDTFKVSMFKYYISNIVIVKNDNSTFSETESYHLIDHSLPASNIVTLTNVPSGSYKSIQFVLGVDSARNRSGSQAGDLDPAKGMFWTWNTGYIMLKLEGTSPQSGDANKNITYHLGGFGGVNKVQRSFSLGFNGNTANVSSSSSPLVHLKVNVNEMFKTPNIVDFSTNFDVTMAGTGAKAMADNYSDMISFDHIHN